MSNNFQRLFSDPDESLDPDRREVIRKNVLTRLEKAKLVGDISNVYTGDLALVSNHLVSSVGYGLSIFLSSLNDTVLNITNAEGVHITDDEKYGFRELNLNVPKLKALLENGAIGAALVRLLNNLPQHHPAYYRLIVLSDRFTELSTNPKMKPRQKNKRMVQIKDELSAVLAEF